VAGDLHRYSARGVISPLLSNIYLHVLDRVWEDRCAHLGTLVRYADDFVVMCDTKAQVEEARHRVGGVLTRLGLELHRRRRGRSTCRGDARVSTSSGAICASG
jgi:Reverse transcriptase (RNA-dependent DNA polymerase)